MVVESDKVTSSNEETMINNDGNDTKALEILRHSANELHRKQTEIHRHIGQLSAVMADFEYHMARIRTVCESSNGTGELCQSLLSHLDAVMFDTRSALVASSTSNNDAQQIHDLVRRLYDENQKIAHHIEILLHQNQPDLGEQEQDDGDEDHIRQAIEQIELALEQNLREQHHLDDEQERLQQTQIQIGTFVHSTEHLHQEALDKLRSHIYFLREHNQTLKQYNQQIDALTQQLPQTLFLSAQ